MRLLILVCALAVYGTAASFDRGTLTSLQPALQSFNKILDDFFKVKNTNLHEHFAGIASAMDNKTEVASPKSPFPKTDQFSAQLHKTVAESQSGNFILSPIGANIISSMAYFGAQGETKTEMKDVLKMTDNENLAIAGYQSLVDTLNSCKEVLKMGNSIFLNKKLTVKPEFKVLTKDYFRSEEEELDFANNYEAAKTINSWCKAKTCQKIKDLVTADALTADTSMVLASAVYFKGQWKNKFDVDKTENKDFHVFNKGVKQVPTMCKTENMFYGYVADLQARFVEIPYNADNLSMIIVLPDQIDGLQKVVNKLGNVNLKSLVESGYFTDVILNLPKFTIQSSFDLQDVLTEMGIWYMFTEEANFRNIADADFVGTYAVQKASIEVDEGTEGAAATGVVAPVKRTSKPKNFIVDRPFLYYIVHNTDEKNLYEKVVLFSGHVTDPQE